MTILINVMFRSILWETQCMSPQTDSVTQKSWPSKVPRRAISNYLSVAQFKWLSVLSNQYWYFPSVNFVRPASHLFIWFHYCTGEKNELIWSDLFASNIFGFTVIADGYKNTCMYILCFSSWQVNQFTTLSVAHLTFNVTNGIHLLAVNISHLKIGGHNFHFHFLLKSYYVRV